MNLKTLGKNVLTALMPNIPESYKMIKLGVVDNITVYGRVSSPCYQRFSDYIHSHRAYFSLEKPDVQCFSFMLPPCKVPVQVRVWR